VASLKRFKDDVREVQEGFECGIQLEGFNDLKEGDSLEFYETRQVERTDLATTTGASE
jgi:translation initiation factor IF-2